MIVQTRNWTHLLLWKQTQTKHKLNIVMKFEMNFVAFYGPEIKIGKMINWIINTDSFIFSEIEILDEFETCLDFIVATIFIDTKFKRMAKPLISLSLISCNKLGLGWFLH